MQATNGSIVLFRSRGRLIGCCLAVVLALTALVLAPAGASAQPTSGGPIYMALGDSISFGYSQQKFNENFPTESPSRFEQGFDNFFNKKLKKEFKGITIDNLACPGETSNGLIGENPLLGGKESTEEASPPALYQGIGDYHPCSYKNIRGFPLHSGYGAISQLEDAISVLTATNPITGKPNEVKAITLNIGSNDEIAAITQCEHEVTEEFTSEGKSKYGDAPEAAVGGCIEFTAEHVTIPHIIANIGQTLGVLDTYYSGPIILLGFFNPQAFVLPGSDVLQEALNSALQVGLLPHFPNVTFANPFGVFNPTGGIDPAKEQAAICKYTEMCNPNVQEGEGLNPESPLFGKVGDVHPSLTGYKKMATLVKAAYDANPAR
jgi:hypothetical protein